MRNFYLYAATATFLLSACSKTDEAKQHDPTAGQDTVLVQDEAVPEASDAAPALANDWTGKWIGVEGTYLTITAKGANKFNLEMQYGLDADMKQTIEGTDVDKGIEFKRGDETLVLKRTDGDATGLKWLAGKKDCLTVKPGEGYCRD